jgi:Raf kinase inhibitor-like YbhB/YbcL family protein
MHAEIRNARVLLQWGAPLLLLLLGGCGGKREAPALSATIEEMRIESTAFSHGGSIPSQYTCDGEDVSLPLRFVDVPTGAVSLALIVDDPDAPVGTWVHWLLWNIDPKTVEIPEGTIPAGAVEGTTSFGSGGYGGPCPPSGTHRYFFKLSAVNTRLNLPAGAGVRELQEALAGHVLAEAQLMGLYSRK